MSLKSQSFLLALAVTAVPVVGSGHCHCANPPIGTSFPSLFVPTKPMVGCATTNTTTTTSNTSSTMTTNTSTVMTTNTTKTMTSNTTFTSSTNTTSTTSTNTTTTSSTTTTTTTNSTQSSTTNTTTTTSTSTTNTTGTTTTNTTVTTSTSNTTSMMTTNTTATMTTNTTKTMTTNMTSTTTTNTSTTTSTSTTNSTKMMTTNTTATMTTNTTKTMTTNTTSTTSTNTSTTTSTTTTNTSTVTTTNTSTTACAEMCRGPGMDPLHNGTMSGDSYTWTQGMKDDSVQLIKTCLAAPIVFGCMPGHRFRNAHDPKPDMDLITPQSIMCQSCHSTMANVMDLDQSSHVWWSVSWGQFIDGHGMSLDSRMLFDYYKVLLVDGQLREVQHVTNVPVCKMCYTRAMVDASPVGCCNMEQYAALYTGVPPTDCGSLHFMVVPCTKSHDMMMPDICLPKGYPSMALTNAQGGTTPYQQLYLTLTIGVNQCPATTDDLVESALRIALANILQPDSGVADPWSRRIALSWTCGSTGGASTLVGSYTLLATHQTYATNPQVYSQQINSNPSTFTMSANTQLRNIQSPVTVGAVSANSQTVTTTNTTSTSTKTTVETSTSTTNATTLTISTTTVTTTTLSTTTTIDAGTTDNALSRYPRVLLWTIGFSMVGMGSSVVDS